MMGSGADKLNNIKPKEYEECTLDLTDANKDVASEISFFDVGDKKEPAMKICRDGKFYVNGKLVKEDIEVYEAFKRWLINQGARLVTSAREVLEEAGVYGADWSKLIPDKTNISQPSFSDELQQKVYQQLLNQPLPTDELAKQLELSIPNLNTALSLLELEGYLHKQNNTWFVKNADSVQ
jgi:hypothetical protein